MSSSVYNVSILIHLSVFVIGFSMAAFSGPPTPYVANDAGFWRQASPNLYSGWWRYVPNETDVAEDNPDKRGLSVDRTRWSAEEAYLYRTVSLQARSDGSFLVSQNTLDKINQDQTGRFSNAQLRPVDDPIVAPPENPHHVILTGWPLADKFRALASDPGTSGAAKKKFRERHWRSIARFIDIESRARFWPWEGP